MTRRLHLKNPFWLLFLVSFLLWLFSFREFLLNHRGLTSDAISYFSHTKFYLDSIRQGVYPLWNFMWGNGAPNEFFLRRISVYNPFIYLTILLTSVGVPCTSAYLLYLSVYYFVGMIGFYLLAKELFRERTAAFTAFLLLLFSSLGMRVFDSFFLLIGIPIIWFFYFLVSFSRQPQRHTLLGLIFTLVILATTYIPFYFLMIFLSFVSCYIIICFKDLKIILLGYGKFIRNNKLFVCFCVVSLMLALVPAALFYIDSKQGEFVLPMRQAEGAPAKDVAQVKQDWINAWAILEELIYSSYYLDNLRRFQFPVLYIPLFAYVLLFLGVLTRLNKLIVFLFVWGLFVLLVGIPNAPLYPFLSQHIFFFKYFRNLHFLLWIVLLPVFILFLVEQFRSFLSAEPNSKREKLFRNSFIIVVHLGLAVFLFSQPKQILSSYFVIALSLIFFLNYKTLDRLKKSRTGLALLLLVIVVQPLEVYHYLPRQSGSKGTYKYEFSGIKFSYTDTEDRPKVRHYDLSNKVDLEEAITRKPSPISIYMGTRWYSFLLQNIDLTILEKYWKSKFIIYDSVEVVDDSDINLPKIARAFALNRNSAFIASAPLPDKKIKPSSAVFQQILGESDQFRVLKFNTNEVRFKIKFDQPKFIVYNDNFHTGWKAFIDGQRAELVRANISFKGLWVPAGEHVVHLRFGTLLRYWLNIGLLLFFEGIFVYLLWLTYIHFKNET